MMYYCDDGNAEAAIEAASAAEAAQEYVDTGDWGENTRTSWITVYVATSPDATEREKITVAIEPEEPECDCDHDHDWRSPYSVLGGLRENPGVWGHGGGVIITEVCAYCGAYRVIDTWAQDPDTGAQGLRSTEYREADDASLAWVESLAQE